MIPQCHGSTSTVFRQVTDETLVWQQRSIGPHPYIESRLLLALLLECHPSWWVAPTPAATVEGIAQVLLDKSGAPRSMT